VISYTIYSRKSLEDDDSQVQSISSQDQAMRSLAGKLNLTVTESLSEAKSAKAPGRPVFEEMMRKVDRGQIQGILCWKLDRLARNPVDGGRVIWAIKQHRLIIRTPHQTFSQAEDNLILMYIEFGMAQKYVDDLSRNTKRGLEAKALKGWFPGVAPIGYLNSKIEERGQRTVMRDPQRFNAVRRMWTLMIAGEHSPAQIQRIANEKWGLRTRQAKRTGGKPLLRSTVYKMFSDPFYCGRFEYPKGSGQWYPGKHDPMVTEEEFAHVQRILHQRTNPRPKTKFELPLRGLLKCGECGSSITAHFKEQVRCTRCGYKSSVKNRDSCSKCLLMISEMHLPKRRQYAYYHCTRTLNPHCRQKCASAKALEQQLTEKLREFALPPELSAWGMRLIEKLRDDEMKNEKNILQEKKAAHEQCVIRLENLVKLKTAPENVAGALLSDEEYQKQRGDLIAQKVRLATDASSFESTLEKKTRIAMQALRTATLISDALDSHVSTRKGELLRAIGLNHVLNDKQLEVRPRFPFCTLTVGGDHVGNKSIPIEPENTQAKQGWHGCFVPSNPKWEPLSEEDRTKRLESALKTVWTRIDPSDPTFDFYPFTDVVRGYRPSRRRGKFISPRDV